MDCSYNRTVCIVSEPTCVLRFLTIKNSHKRILQQKFLVKKIDDRGIMDTDHEWRDVPLVLEEQS